MKNLFSVFFIIFTFFLNAQNGETILYFKNGDTVMGSGTLKGTKYINFKKENTSKNIKFSFDILEKAEIKFNDTVTITYKLFPITKKNGDSKEASVLGELISGNVSLYVKGDIFHESSPLIMNNTELQNLYSDIILDYFIRKHDEKNVVHIHSDYFPIEKMLRFTDRVFSDCPEIYQNILSEKFKTINEAIDFYNKKCPLPE